MAAKTKFDQPSPYVHLTAQEVKHILKHGLLDMKGTSKEWNDKELDEIWVLLVPPLTNRNIKKIFLMWVLAIKGLREDLDVTYMTVVLAMQLRHPLNYKQLVLDLENVFSTDEFKERLKTESGKWISAFDTLSSSAEAYEQACKKFSPKIIAKEEIMVEAVLLANQNPRTGEFLSIFEFLVWCKDIDQDIVSAYISYMMMCCLRIMTCTVKTIAYNLNRFHDKFSTFYSQTGPPIWLKAIPVSELSQLKVAMSPGKTLASTVMVPVVRKIVLHESNTSLMDEKEREVVLYTIAMATEYNGLYLPQAYIKAVAHTGISDGTLLDKIYKFSLLAKIIKPGEFKRLEDLLLNYVSPTSTGKHGWRWARILRSDYLSEYSGPQNSYLCAVLTALFASEDDNVWKKNCFLGKPEEVELAKCVAFNLLKVEESVKQIPKHTDGVKPLKEKRQFTRRFPVSETCVPTSSTAIVQPKKDQEGKTSFFK